MNQENRDLIAIDVAKSTLRVQTEQKAFDISNNPEGFVELLKQIKSLKQPFVVLEATGGYERGVMAALYSRNIPLSLINPAQARHFAKSEGLKAKNDPIDAKMLLRFAQQKKPRPTPKPEPVVEELAALLDRRSHLTEQLAREKNRLQNSSHRIHGSIKKMIAFIELQIRELETQIERLIDEDDDLKGRCETMLSVKGIGKITAWTICAYLSEITVLSRNQTVALAGLAPYDNDSATIKRKRSIQAGRAKVRSCLYMATRTAKRCNPVIQQYAQRLEQRGKPKKMVNVAAMRKILIHLHSLLKKEQVSLA